MSTLAVYGAFLLLAAAPTVAPPSIDRVVADHITALGGMTKIAAIHSVVERGRYVEGSEQIDTYAAQKRPFYRVITNQ